MKTNLMKVLLVLSAICGLIIALFCLITFKIGDEPELINISGRIRSYDYNQYVKVSDFCFEVENNNQIILLEIYSYNVPFFNRNDFEQNYSKEKEYTFQVSKKDYISSSGSIEVFGISCDSADLLTIQNTIKSNANNSFLKLAFAIVLLLFSLLFWDSFL